MASINLVINFSTLSWLMMRKHWHETHCISSLKLFFRCQELKTTITWSRYNNFFNHSQNCWNFKFYWSNIDFMYKYILHNFINPKHNILFQQLWKRIMKVVVFLRFFVLIFTQSSIYTIIIMKRIHVIVYGMCGPLVNWFWLFELQLHVGYASKTQEFEEKKLKMV